MHFMCFYLFYLGDLVTCRGMQEIRSVCERLPDNPGVLACDCMLLRVIINYAALFLSSSQQQIHWSISSLNLSIKYHQVPLPTLGKFKTGLEGDYKQFGPVGEGGLPIMAYMGRLRPIGVPFSCVRCMKG